MKKLYLFILSSFLFACNAGVNHSWVVVDHPDPSDYSVEDCTLLYNRRLYIGNSVRWYDINGAPKQTSKNFDLGVVREEDYYKTMLDLQSTGKLDNVNLCHQAP